MLETKVPNKTAEYFLNRALAVFEARNIEVKEVRQESKALFVIDASHTVVGILDMRTGVLIKPDANPYTLTEEDIIAIIPTKGITV